MVERSRDILGIGNALVDVVSHNDDAFLAQHQLIKGSMMLIEADRAEAFYQQMESPVECSGGSVANSMVGLAALGASSVFIGKVRADRLGQVFSNDIRSTGVEFDVPASTSGPSTGRCLIVVTPDAQRTMQTYLGASTTLDPMDIDPDTVRSARMVYLEGYLFDPPPAKAAFLKAAEIAQRAGRKVVLNLSDSFCVDRHRTDFMDLVEQHVDVLLSNEQEIMSLYQTTQIEDALSRLRNHCELAAITLGEKGSVVVSAEGVFDIDPQPAAQLVDTTGAGDLFASGFLFGLIRGRALVECGRLGSATAAEIVARVGARPGDSLKNLAKELG